MAGGTITFPKSGYLQGKIDWSSVSNGAEANTSKVTTKLYARRTNSSTTSGKSWSGEAKVGSNEPHEFSGFSKSTSITNSWVLFGTYTDEVEHNEDGTCSVVISGSVTGPDGTSLEGVTSSGSQTVTLDKIDRGDIIGEIEDFIIDEPITIPISSFLPGFTNSLMVYVNDTPVKSVESIVNGDEVEFTDSELLSIYSLLPNTITGTFKFELTSIGQSEDGTDITVKTSKTATGTIPSSVVPNVEFTVSEYVEDIATKIGKYVVGKSRLNIDASASKGGTGSSVASYKIVANGETFNTSQAITSLLTNSGVNSISVIVKDTRGRESLEGVTIDVLDYALPKAGGLSVYRCNSDGTLNDEGVYVKAYVNYEIAPLEDKNSKRVLIQYLNGETWTTVKTIEDSYVGDSEVYVITNTEFNIDNTYEFRLVVEDYFSIDEWNALPLLPSYTLMNYHASGKAIGFGKVATREEGFQFGDFIYDQWDTVITNGLAVYGGDPDTTMESLIMTSTNSPNGEAMFFFTFFSSNKSESQNCGQIAVPYYYNGTQSIYWRYRFAGWSEWVELANKSQVDDLTSNVNLLKEVVLYDNETGSSGAITLSESAENFKYIEIFYKNNDNTFSSVKVYKPNSKEVEMSSITRWSSTIYLKQRRATISGTSISQGTYSETSLTATPKISIGTSSNPILITRVVGYKN